MELPILELQRLLQAAREAKRPVTIDWDNRTLTVLEYDGSGARKLYVIRHNNNGTMTITDRT